MKVTVLLNRLRTMFMGDARRQREKANSKFVLIRTVSEKETATQHLQLMPYHQIVCCCLLPFNWNADIDYAVEQ